MKKVTIMMVIALSVMTSVFAQKKNNRVELTEVQKTEMTAVHEKYASDMKELKDEMRLIQTEQKALLSSEEINEKAIYAKLEEMSEAKAKMQKQQLSMRIEMQEIAPDMAMKGRGHARQGEGCSKQGEGRSEKGCAKEGGNKGGEKSDKCCSKDECKAGDKSEMRGQRGEHKKPAGECEKKGKSHDAKGAKCTKDAALALSDEQKTQMADIKKAHFWTIQELENKMAVLKAENTSLEDQLSSINDFEKVQLALAKEKMTQRLEMMNVLTEEQRMQSIAKQGQRGHQPNRGQKRN